MSSCILGVLQAGTVLAFEHDGLFHPDSTRSFTLRAAITDPPRPIYAFFVGGTGNIESKVNLEEQGAPCQRYELTISPQQVRLPGIAPQPRLLNTQNTLRFAVLNPENGSFQIWEVSVVCQNGQFFLVQQTTRTATPYRMPDGQVCYPEFNSWPQMNAFLLHKIEPYSLSLRDVSCFVPPQVTAPQEKDLAVINWYNYAHGFGHATFSGGVARVCWENIYPNGHRFVHLDAGNIVRFGSVSTPIQHSSSRRRTTFSHELFDVELVRHS